MVSHILLLLAYVVRRKFKDIPVYVTTSVPQKTNLPPTFSPEYEFHMEKITGRHENGSIIQTDHKSLTKTSSNQKGREKKREGEEE
uniref:Uncharacterized protein n=1 Tax=Glossina pallidipes TaxID=7398 RepID=A0A1A9ZIX5_GLOPL